MVAEAAGNGMGPGSNPGKDMGMIVHPFIGGNVACLVGTVIIEWATNLASLWPNNEMLKLGGKFIKILNL